LINEFESNKLLKSKDLTFDPNEDHLRLPENAFVQTLHFKNKKNSFKKYMKRQAD